MLTLRRYVETKPITRISEIMFREPTNQIQMKELILAKKLAEIVKLALSIPEGVVEIKPFNRIYELVFGELIF